MKKLGRIPRNTTTVEAGKAAGFPLALEKLENLEKLEKFFKSVKSQGILKFYQKVREKRWEEKSGNPEAPDHLFQNASSDISAPSK